MKKIATLICLCAALCLVGCNKQEEVPSANGPYKKITKEEKVGDAIVLAKVGNENITDKDIETLFKNIPEPYRARYETPEVKKEIVMRLIEVKMMAQEAKNRKLDSKDDVKLKLALMSDQILAKELEEAAVDEIKVSDKAIDDYYKANAAQFVSPRRFKVSHILVKDEAKAATLLARVKKGEDFAAIAKADSVCPSATQGGDLGWISAGRMDPTFEKAAFALKKGEVSGIVKTQFGYHIIKVNDIEEQHTKPLAEVKDRIVRTLKQGQEQGAMTKLRDEMLKKAKVAVYDDYFAAKPGQTPSADQAPATEQALPAPATAPAAN